MYYDKSGQPIKSNEFCKLAKDMAYKRIAETTLNSGRRVSTVWLGLNHNFDVSGPPLIFETMVFPSEKEWSELDCRRYATEQEALAGHRAMVEKWENENPN